MDDGSLKDKDISGMLAPTVENSKPRRFLKPTRFKDLGEPRNIREILSEGEWYVDNTNHRPNESLGKGLNRGTSGTLDQ